MRTSWLSPVLGLFIAVASAASPRAGTTAQAPSAVPDWFLPSGPGLPRVTQGNMVTPLVDGDETFQSMAEVIATARPRLTRIDGFAGQTHNDDPQGPIAENPVDH